jgi:hypothetical protein
MLRVGPCRQRFPRLHVQLFGKKDTARPHCILRTRRVCGVPDLTSSVGSGQWAPSGSWKDGRVTGNVRQGPAPTCRTTAFRGYGTVQGRVRKPAHPDSNGSCGEEGGPGPGPAHVPSPSRHRSGDGNALPVPIPIFHGAAVAPPRHHACRLRHTTLELVPSCVCAPPCVCPSGERRILPSSFVPSTYPYVSVSPPRRGRRWPEHRLFSRPRE